MRRKEKEEKRKEKEEKEKKEKAEKEQKRKEKEYVLIKKAIKNVFPTNSCEFRKF